MDGSGAEGAVDFLSNLFPSTSLILLLSFLGFLGLLILCCDFFGGITIGFEVFLLLPCF